MSAFRGQTSQSAQEFVQALREVVRELDGFGRTTRDVTRASETRVRAERDVGASIAITARTQGRAAGLAVAGGAAGIAGAVAGNLFDFGSQFNAEASLSANALRAASSLPVVGPIFGRDQSPIDRAAARTLAVTGVAARYGGKPDDRTRQALMDKFLAQERLVEGEMRQVDILSQGAADKVVDVYGVQARTIWKGLEMVGADWVNRSIVDWMIKLGGPNHR